MLITPDWPDMPGVLAFSTTREGGVSAPPYDSLNLGAHVGDDEQSVLANRAVLQQQLQLDTPPAWLNQVHGTRVVELPLAPGDIPDADASYSRTAGDICLVMTADCLPVLLRSKHGDEVAAAHAGWRGLVNGVLEATLAQFDCPASDIQAWLGPAIGPRAFEVGAEVRQAFVEVQPEADKAFVKAGDKYLADLYQLARLRLEAKGITQVFGGQHCTHSEPQRFFSYRRDSVTGRQASGIVILPDE